ncbi:MAG: MFS transporter [Betaproteobacteria bacterium]|nr:MFS transporter [Betaproteobacteria bacterium]
MRDSLLQLDTTPALLRQRFRHDTSTILLVSVAHGLTHFFHLLLPPLFPVFTQQFHVSYIQLGLLMSLFFSVSAIGQFFSGFVVHRFGPVLVLYLGMGMLVCSGLCLFLADRYTLLLLSALFSGLGNAVIHPVNYSIINFRIHPDRLGHAFSTHSLAGTAGWVLAPPFVLFVSFHYGWHAVGLGSALLAAFTLLSLLWNRNLIQVGHTPSIATHTPSAPPSPGARLGFLFIPTIWLSFAYFFLSNTAFGALQSYLIPLLKHYYGLSLHAATFSMTGLLVGNGLGVIAGGFLANRQAAAHQNTIVIALTCSAGLAVLLASETLPAAMVYVMLPAMGFSMGLAGPFRHLMARIAAQSDGGRHCQSCIYGFVYAGQDLGTSITPAWAGQLMDSQHFMGVFMGIALFQGGAVLAALLESRKGRPA